jgi:hypothetical protein
MSTNESTKDGLRLSDWSWLGPWAMFMAAFAAVLDTDRGPVESTLLGLVILGAGYICYFTWREQRREKRN